MEEARSGGLIDRYWIFDVIIMPTLTILTLVGCFYLISSVFKCPYTEDVSSCFPYNLPNFPLIILNIVLIILVIIIKINGKLENGKSNIKTK